MKRLKKVRLGLRILIAGLGLMTLCVFLTTAAYGAAYWGKIVPGVEVLGIELGNKTGEEAAEMIEEKLKKNDWEAVINHEDTTRIIKSEEIEANWKVPETVNAAWSVGRQGSIWDRAGQAWGSYFKGHKIKVVVDYNQDTLEDIVEEIGKEIDSPLVLPSLSLINKQGVKSIELIEGNDGLITNKELVIREIVGSMEELDGNQIQVQTKKLLTNLTAENAESAKQQAEKLIGKQLKFKLDDEEWAWNDEQLISSVWVVQGGGFDGLEVTQAVESLAQGINRQPQNAVFQFENGRVKEFRPGRDGIAVDEARLALMVVEAYEKVLADESTVLEVPVTRELPVTSTADVNNLGIKELVGKGNSTYFHSIPNRIDNVGLASARINGVIVAPGTEFSFNENLGEVSAATGYKSAYIIENGRTVLGDGGGVCQVSTTLFRAILDAGLPIVERRSHSYRVGYYEQNSQPGIDATVSAPSVDLKFKNDTPGYLLIQMINDPAKRSLVVEIYGTSDGRVANISKVKVWGQTPPPPTLYQDDPTLAVGVLKQIDFAASGAKASFDYKVTRNGETIFEKTFYSNYRPWQAIFLKGTKI